MKTPRTPHPRAASCLLLMCGLPSENWLRLLIWFALGMLIYLFYGRRHSVLAWNENRLMMGMAAHPG